MQAGSAGAIGPAVPCRRGAGQGPELLGEVALVIEAYIVGYFCAGLACLFQKALRLLDPELLKPRRARNHRAIIREAWHEATEARPPHPRLGDSMREVATRHDPQQLPHAKLALKGLLLLMCEVAPVPAAMLLFGEGLVHVHHTAKAHRLAREAAGDAEAITMLEDIQARVEEMEPERAQHLVALLLDTYAK